MAAIAIAAGMRVDDLAQVPLSFPTYAGILGRVAASATRQLNLKGAGKKTRRRLSGLGAQNRGSTGAAGCSFVGEALNASPERNSSPASACGGFAELMQKATSVAMLAFVLSSMLAMGLGLTVSQIIAPLRNARLVVLSLLVNFVLMPLGAVALAALLRLDQPLGVGLLLLGSAAGAPFLPKLAQIAQGNLAFAVGLMVLLMVVTVGYLPLVLPLLLPGVSVNPAKIARSLFLLMLLPLAGALAVKARFADVAARTKPLLDRLSNLSLILLVLLITAGNVNNVLAVFGTRGILAGLLFIAIGFVIGWLLGGPDRILDGSSPWAPRNATLPPRSWWGAKVSATRKWSSWWSS